MASLYDFPDIYDERFSEKANTVYREHYQKMFSGCEITDILDCSFGTGDLTFELCVGISGVRFRFEPDDAGQGGAKSRAERLPGGFDLL